MIRSFCLLKQGLQGRIVGNGGNNLKRQRSAGFRSKTEDRTGLLLGPMRVNAASGGPTCQRDRPVGSRQWASVEALLLLPSLYAKARYN
jgi:hypothetical protein